MALTKEEREKLDKTHDRVAQIATVLLGTNGDDGLIGDVKINTRALMTLTEKHNSLNQNFWILVAGLGGSGMLGGGIWAYLAR